MEVWNQFSELCAKKRQVDQINSLLSWDQEVLMPRSALAQRADQVSYIQFHLHELKTSPRFVGLAEELWGNKNQLEAWQRRVVEIERKEIRRASKMPSSLVQEIAKETVKSQEVWKQARTESKFEIFAPALERVLELSQQKAQCLNEGAQEDYEVLLDLYESDVKLKDARILLDDFRKQLVPNVSTILDRVRTLKLPKADLFAMPKAQQQCLNEKALEWIGFDLNAGRLDSSTHPFCSGSAYDVRLTTRYNELDFTSSLFGVLHEGGHGIYEQNLGKSVKYAELRTAASFGLHESQSRFWENLIGRSRAFCDQLVAKMKEWKVEFQGSGDDLYSYVNRVRPSFIRVEADEVTYNLHILIRFELEQALFEKSISVRDLPSAWNEKYKAYLGLEVKDIAQGVLQDIHWSLGLFGYFPTYSFGNLISVQLLEAMNRDFSVERQTSTGDLTPIKKWLTDRVHSRGSLLPTWELLREVSGTAPKADPFVGYLKQKYLG